MTLSISVISAAQHDGAARPAEWSELAAKAFPRNRRKPATTRIWSLQDLGLEPAEVRDGWAGTMPGRAVPFRRWAILVAERGAGTCPRTAGNAGLDGGGQAPASIGEWSYPRNPDDIRGRRVDRRNIGARPR